MTAHDPGLLATLARLILRGHELISIVQLGEAETARRLNNQGQVLHDCWFDIEGGIIRYGVRYGTVDARVPTKAVCDWAAGYVLPEHMDALRDAGRARTAAYGPAHPDDRWRKSLPNEQFVEEDAAYEAATRAYDAAARLCLAPRDDTPAPWQQLDLLQELA